MRLDVTSAKTRKRLVAELSARASTHAKKPEAPAQHDAPPLHPEAAQPKPVQEAQKLVTWAQAALSVVLGLRLPLDGVLNGTTQMAIRRFQGQSALPQSGSLDAATVLALAKAIGHPAPGMSSEHRIMPRWFRQERQSARAKAQPVAHKKSQGPDDAWQEAAPEHPVVAPQPMPLPRPAEPAVVAEVAPHKKLRTKETT